jgi:hypothetical protein
MAEVRKTKELDYYLKRIILKVPDKIQQFIDNENGEFSMTYYTGNWSKDIYDNFTDLQAEKIFKNMAQFQNKISFVQKKNELSIGGYEYKVARF